MAELTARQYIALRAYYVEGMSHSAISRTLGCSRQNTHELVSTARAKVIRFYEDGILDIQVLVEGLLRPAAHSSPSSNLGVAASRQDELLDALELRMQQRALEIQDISECMSGNSFMPTHIKRNQFDQWELRFLNGSINRHSLPMTAYRSLRAAGFCAEDYTLCPCGCAGCRACQP